MNWIKKGLDSFALNRVSKINPFITSTSNPFQGFQFLAGKAVWTTLQNPQDFENVVRFNPIVKAALNLRATSASNGVKVARDTKTDEIIPWTDKDKAIQQAKRLFVDRPNPLQSGREFSRQGMFYLDTFGNRYVYANMPIGFNSVIDLMNIETLINLPSQFMTVKTTGKLYDQTTLKGIIETYSRTDVMPAKLYDPEEILHFNEVNISSYMPTVMGISKIEVLQMPITNIQLCFEAMNTLLRNRGMAGIISPKKTDGMGASMALTPDEEKKTREEFKKDYGLLNGQNPFMLSPVALDYYKTALNSSEMGIYDEFSNNTIIVCNEFGIPPTLLKTYMKGDTYENQIQSIRRLYQDTTIPLVKEEDTYWNYRCNLEKYGFYLDTIWDHIPALAESFKEKAVALNMNGRTGNEAYNNNIITRNQYLELLDLSPVSDGDVYKYEWDKKINANNQNNGTQANT